MIFGCPRCNEKIVASSADLGCLVRCDGCGLLIMIRRDGTIKPLGSRDDPLKNKVKGFEPLEGKKKPKIRHLNLGFNGVHNDKK